MGNNDANFKGIPPEPTEAEPNRNTDSGAAIVAGSELADLGMSGMIANRNSESTTEAVSADSETALVVVGTAAAEVACEAVTSGVGSTIGETIGSVLGGLFDGL